MKKTILCTLLLGCLLCACTETPEENAGTSAPEPAAEMQIMETREPAFLQEDSSMARFTDGAVQTFQMRTDNPLEIVSMGKDLLLFSQEDNTVLTRLTGEQLTPIVRRTLSSTLLPHDPSVQVGDGDVVYFDREQSRMVILDGMLEEKTAVMMPQDLTGTPILSGDRTRVFYTVGGDVRILDLQTGISRLLKQTECTSIQLLGLYADTTVLEISGEKASGDTMHILISADSGETLYAVEESEHLRISGDHYYLQEMTGSVRQLIYSQFDAAPRCLVPEETEYEAVPIPEWNGYLTLSRTDGGILLSYYDLQTGNRVSAVTLPDGAMPQNFLAEKDGSRIFFTDPKNSGELYGWDLSMTPSREIRNYTDVWYTAENPDTEGLANCEDWAKRINEKYGVHLAIWQDALNLESAKPEYQVPAYRRDMKILEKAMAKLPEGFLKELAAGTDSGMLNISMVRSVDESELENGIQYWEDGDAYLVLVMGQDIEKSFYHGISHMIDNRVFGTCTLFDDWETLNPEDFSYDYDYEKNKARDGSKYLQPDTRAFADIYSMSFPKEDRAGIFEYAMTETDGTMFASEIMQNKLRRMSLGIRKAFDMEDLPKELPWEVWLDEPVFETETEE